MTTCDQPLDEAFWDTRYRLNETGWDLGEVSPPLRAYIDTLSNKQVNILIPGCGNAYEAEYLVQAGFRNITVLDISSEAVARLQSRLGHMPVKIVHADFFEHTGVYDLILEQTFFCAIPPALRERYAVHTYSLLKPGGTLAGVLFDRTFDAPGPPFGGHRDDYAELFEPFFHRKVFDTCHNSALPRRGTEIFIELVKKDLPPGAVRMFTIHGITCEGCKREITHNFLKIPGVHAARINTAFNEVMIVCQPDIPDERLLDAVAHDSKYKLIPVKKV